MTEGSEWEEVLVKCKNFKNIFVFNFVRRVVHRAVGAEVAGWCKLPPAAGVAGHCHLPDVGTGNRT